MKCPKCQAENSDSAKFCIDCGQSLQTDLTCPHCKHANKATARFCEECGQPLAVAQSPSTAIETQPRPSPAQSVPSSFAHGRYQVKKFLGEGGKKKVYLAHDTVLDRDVAFALIKTEKLDETARTRIKREAQAMGRLGDHPNIVTVFDFGDHEGQPYMVLPLLSGGDVEGLIKKAPDHKLPLDQSIEIAKSVCKGLQFAHAKGIIHRDIKPGNVWMSADGTAQIGDFGLAVAVDRSRLTQVGMMVGTVSYMPPEQAMGGEVTARADLYSLGAMLYEMVTGRPPFVGDDSVAIIGQHINTSPVSPSWHRADLPPSLETLIMQLLEKDAEKRPASAAVVLQAIESIGAGKTKHEPAEKALPMENPLYRRVFVGREAELKELQAAFDGAMSGQGALTMVLGEPGIGKTALCEQLATYVTLRGGKTLVGHCYEEGSLSLPYLAFVEALRSYVLDRGADELRRELGSGATDVARIVSEIREKLDVKPRAAENPEEDRYRLLQSVSSFLTNAGAVKPLFVLLEDLHDADKGTLEMLTYVSRNLSGSRLLVVGTYRDVEVDRTHPLSAALAELRRVSTFGRVILRGLNADEVHRMLKSITHYDVPWSLAEAVHRQTEGNPLFVQEVVRYLSEEGLVKMEGGRWKGQTGTALDMAIPEGLRDVIGKRVSLLSKDCNQLLSVASVIGREFGIETLRTVAGMSEDAFVAPLKEAVRLSVLEERSLVGQVRYRFTHAFFRQTLYEEMIAPERLRLHQHVARVLETLHASRLEEHAAELAEHFSQSTDPDDLRKAVDYGQMAARRAEDVYAYGEAVRLLDQAIRVQRVLDPNDTSRMCDLLLDLCDALYRVPDAKRVLNTEAPAAFALAEILGDDSRAVKACRFAMMSFVVDQGTAGYFTPQFAEWAVRADRHAKPDSVERAVADWARGTIMATGVDRRAGARLLENAVSLSRDLRDPLMFQLAASALISYRTGPRHAEENGQLAEEMLSNPQFNYVLARGAVYSGNIIHTFLVLGKRKRCEEAWHDMLPILERASPLTQQLRWASLLELLQALFDGRLQDVMASTARMRDLAEQRGWGAIGGEAAYAFDIRARILLGTAMDDPGLLPGAFQGRVASCIVQAYQGHGEEAARGLNELVLKRPGIGTTEDEAPGWADIVMLEAGVVIGHREIAGLLLRRFEGSSIRTSGRILPTCAARHMGGAAALLERYDEARQHYQEAIAVCTEMRFRPELALTRLQLAELMLDHYPAEKKDALEHLDFAIKEFREMKMQPSLERALRRKEILKA